MKTIVTMSFTLMEMFEETVIESDGIKGLKHFALYHDITDETIAEAKQWRENVSF